MPPTADAKNLLDAYRKAPASTSRKVTERLKSGVDMVRDRAHALKLKHEVKNLRRAMNDTWEQIGILTLQHRPSGVALDDGMAELSRLQAETAEKEVTLGSLLQAKGGGSVVKELKRELATLRDRQRTVMIEIGRRMEPASAEPVPSIAAHFRAIDRLRISLEAKEREYGHLEARLGPITDSQTFRAPMSLLTAFLTARRKPLLFGAGVMASVIMLYVVATYVFGLSFSGGLGRYQYYVPDDAENIAFVNIDKLRDTKLYKKIMKTMPLKPVMGILGIDLDTTAELFLVGTPPFRMIVLRTTEDRSLEDVASAKRDSFSSYRGFEYVKADQGSMIGQYAAKTGNRMYCFAREENDLKAALKRLDDKEQPRLGEPFKEAIASVAGKEAYVVFDPGGTPFSQDPKKASPKVMSIGVSIGSSVDADGIAVFASNDDAKDGLEELRTDVDDSIQKARKGLQDAKGAKRRELEQEIQALEALKFSRSGHGIEFRWDYDIDPLIDLLDQAKDLFPPGFPR